MRRVMLDRRPPCRSFRIAEIFCEETGRIDVTHLADLPRPCILGVAGIPTVADVLENVRHPR